MPTPLTYQKIQTSTGPISIPIYNIGDVVNNSFRIMTSKGLGCYDLIAPTSATPLRIQTNSGIKGVNMQQTAPVTTYRYVRDWAGANNGSVGEKNGHWQEIVVRDINGINVALNKTTTYRPVVGGVYNTHMVNDGISNVESNYTQINIEPTTDGFNMGWVVIDLGALYELSNITVWHYYTDARTYFGTKTEVSTDGVNWVAVFDSATSGTYVETSAGKTHLIPNAAQPNLLLYSEDFSQSAWLKGASTTAVANNVAMPIGTGTFLSQLKTVTVGQVYTFTVWVQSNAGDISDFDIWAGRTNSSTIDYGSKVCTPTGTLTAHSYTFTATSTTCYVGFDNVNGQTSPNILAKAKLERAATSTRYIKTP